MTTLPSRPPNDAIWATDDVNNVEPTEEKKELGWENLEEPPAAFFNWWQNRVYTWQAWARDAIDALQNGKVDIIGSTSLSGNFRPLADLGANLGGVSRRFDNLFARNSNLNVLSVSEIGGLTGPDFNVEIVSDIVVDTSEVDINLGANVSGQRFSSGSFEQLNSVNTSLSNATISALNAQVAAFQSAQLVAGSIGNVRIERTEPAPTSQEQMLFPNRRGIICAAVNTGSGSSPVLSNQLNVASVDASAIGIYVYTLNQPVRDDAVVVPAINDAGDISDVANFPTITGHVTDDGETITVRTARIGVYQRYPHSLIVVGRPRTL